MFNVYAFDRKKLLNEDSERGILRSAQIHEKMKNHRDRLYENYMKRINDFILHMEKQPIRINSYQSPIENAGRISDPSKFKGKPRIIVREYKTHRERLIESMKYASIHSPQLNNDPNAVIKGSASAKSLKPKRMYFKAKSNLERVVDELKARHVDLKEYDPKKPKKSRQNLKFSPRKTWVALQNYVTEPPHEKPDDSASEEEIIPKQIFAGLHNKTYFKGVTSMLIQSDASKRAKGDIDTFAEEILESCNVKPKVNQNFLRIGGGKLVSNPEETIKDTYIKLKGSLRDD